MNDKLKLSIMVSQHLRVYITRGGTVGAPLTASDSNNCCLKITGFDLCQITGGNKVGVCWCGVSIFLC